MSEDLCLRSFVYASLKTEIRVSVSRGARIASKAYALRAQRLRATKIVLAVKEMTDGHMSEIELKYSHFGFSLSKLRNASPGFQSSEVSLNPPFEILAPLVSKP